jgi:hypothetical protein
MAQFKGPAAILQCMGVSWEGNAVMFSAGQAANARRFRLSRWID